MDLILSRRSIRKYTDEPVADGVVRELLKAAMSAPSAGNQQPWYFVVINQREILDAVSEFHPHSLMLRQAPVAILVCADLQLETHQGYWVQDCSAATQNILLAVQAKGLGACWLGIYPQAERIAGMCRLVGLPEHVIPLALVAIGHPAVTKPPANRFNADRIRYNHW
ncbi:MAG: nitroreductase family protein [Heliobacteriaceae bacterium]|nr:nitroreductase family protein [Heliobacteriaceae bacterium]MDD4588051.1 nitroreductase family protein [Heliobacteriaceae bacterium]